MISKGLEDVWFGDPLWHEETDMYGSRFRERWSVGRRCRRGSGVGEELARNPSWNVVFEFS